MAAGERAIAMRCVALLDECVYNQSTQTTSVMNVGQTDGRMSLAMSVVRPFSASRV